MFKLIKRYLFTFIATLRLGACVERPKVYGYSRFSKNTCMGRNANFNGLIVYGEGAVSIGDNFHSGKGCILLTQSHNYNGNAVPYDETYMSYKITIEDNVWFGINVIVIGNVTIGEGAVIQAGSVVVKSIPKFAIAGGSPAKVFASRDVIRYHDLVGRKSFH